MEEEYVPRMDKKKKKSKKYKIIATPKPSSFFYRMIGNKPFVWSRYSTKKGAEEALKSLINKYSDFYEFELHQNS